MRAGWVGAGVMAIALACQGPSYFGCDDDSQCQADSAAGTCEVNGYCSFPDPECESGRRYSELAGGGLAGLCVLDEGQETEAPASTGAVVTSSGGAMTSTAGDATAAGSTSIGVDDTTSGDSSAGDSGTTTGAIVTDGLVLWYDFEDAGGQGAADVSGHGRDASCEVGACPSAEPGPVGTAASFDGVSDLLELADEPAVRFDPAYSASVWTRLDSAGTTRVLWGKAYGPGGNNSYEMFLGTTDDELNLNQDTGTSGRVSLTPMPVGQWVHLVGTFDGDTLRLYVDGVLHGERSGLTVPIYDDHPLTVGGDYSGDPPAPSNLWHGAIDELRLYDRVLSEGEVAELFAEGTPP